MTIQTSSGALNNLLLQLLQQRVQPETPAPASIEVKPQRKTTSQDIMSLSGQKSENAHEKYISSLSQNQSMLVDETTKEVENGYRRTQEFKNSRGQEFTRIEEVTTTHDRTKRVIIQEKTSGSTTALESIFDRQTNGTFRLTQRYTDETGQTSTNIELGVTPTNADIVLGRPPKPSEDIQAPPHQNSRGSQFDMSV